MIEKLRQAQQLIDEVCEEMGGAIADPAVVAPFAVPFGDFRLSGRSLKRLDGVHPDLIAVVEYAIRVTSVDFGITRTGGVRTREMQRKLVDAGKSGTMRSRHRTGHAVDIAPLDPKTGKYSRQPRHAIAIHVAFELASDALDVPLRYGGDWDGDGEWREKGENDLVHHELPRSDYRDNKSSQSEKAAAFLASIAAGGFA